MIQNESGLDPSSKTLSTPILCEAEHQLAEYFAGARKSFELPLDFAGTPFHKRVWAEC
jgi:methylated-DNA-[protein]-cysteine S-methyltransferase